MKIGDQAFLGSGTRPVVVMSAPRHIAGGDVVLVAWLADDVSQRLLDGSIHPAHRAGFQWEEPACNLTDMSADRKSVFDGLVHRMTRWSGMWRPICDGPSLVRGLFMANLHDPVSAAERALGPVDCPRCKAVP